MRNILDRSYIENQNTRFVFKHVSFENRAVFQIMWKNILDPGRTHDNTMHAHCMLDAWGYGHTLRICNADCFSTGTMIAREIVSVRFNVHCLSCLG